MSVKNYLPYLCHGDFSDLFVEESSSLTLRWEDRKVESISRFDESGLGLRIFNGEETRYGHLDVFRPFSGRLTAREKSELEKLHHRFSSGLSAKVFRDGISLVKKFHPIKCSPQDVALEKKMGVLKKAFEATQISPLIRQVRIQYGERVKKVGSLNSLGEGFIEERTYVVFNVTVTAEGRGQLQNAYESLGGIVGFELFEGKRAEKMARLVAERALKKLEAPVAPVGEMPVVIHSSAGGTLIHEAVGHSLEADAVIEGTSPAYAGKLGKQVANSKLTVLDDPTVPGARGSYCFDDEGTPSETTALVDHGILRDYLFDRRSARRMKRQSNGHGRRESFAHRPIPRMSNTLVAPGPDDPDAILKELRNGLLVTRMGGGQVNTANGDFVFDVEEGFDVKEGKRTLIRGATLLGNGPRVLMDIDRVGSDRGWGVGTCGKEGQGVPVSDALPTVRIKKLVVGGGQ